MPRYRSFVAILVAAVMLVSVGCKKMSQVSGVVTLEGEPLPNATVTFTSVSGENVSIGHTDEMGKFKLHTRKPGDGVLKGEYKITVDVASKNQSSFDQPTRNLDDIINQKTPEKSPLHPNYTNPDKTPLTQTVPVKGAVEINLKSDGT